MLWPLVSSGKKNCLYSLKLLTKLVAVFISANATVTLDSSADSVCPGDTVVFTCATDTGELIWSVNGTLLYYSNTHEQRDVRLSIFEFHLMIKTGVALVSTATVQNARYDGNGTVLSCSDNSIPQLSNTDTETVSISGPPSPPCTVTSCFTPFSVTISWVVPLDTPLCVHSYTVTVNSSQVLVYNTTDNRSSLSITDLTSDGEYSVTVAGRDGAGRLGQESEELNIRSSASSLACNYSTISHTVLFSRSMYVVFIQWKLTGKFQHDYFMITHNVSSDQSPITTNRTNVTLYGVQPGETYTVEIFPYPIQQAAMPSVLQIKIPVDMSDQQMNSGWVAPMIALPWLLFVISIATIILCIVTTKVDKSKWNIRFSNLYHQFISNKRPGTEGLQASMTYYEQVQNNSFTMRDNPSYAQATSLAST